jgi:5-methylcytosine-specific restriction endonuclease McrA
MASKKPNVQKRISRLQKKLDRLIQLYFVPKFPNCYLCPNETSEMHHFIQKKQSTALRYDPINLIPLCKSCHCRLHKSDYSVMSIKIKEYKGDKWFNDILRKRNLIVKRNLEYEEKLKKLIKYYGSNP